MPAHRERELACARGSAGRPGSADNSTACSAPRAAQGTFSTSNRQPPPAAYAAEQPAPTELAQLQAPCRSRRVEHARPQGVGASRSPRRRWRRSRRSRNGGGQPRGSTRQEACQRWAAPARAARIALPQQVRLEGWSTRLSGRRKGGCGENGTYAPPEALDTNDGPQPARHGQQGRCRRS